MADETPAFLTAQKMEDFLRKVSVHFPDNQEFFMVSKDRASLVFMQWRDRIRSRTAWQAPAATGTSLAVTLATVSFTDLSWIKGATLKDTFMALFGGSLVWLIYEIARLVRSRGAVSPEKFIAELSAGTQTNEIPAPDGPKAQ